MGIVPIEGTAIYWLDVPAEFSIVDGIGCCTVRSGDLTIHLRSTKATMVKGWRNGGRAIAGEAAGAMVVPFKRKKRHHH